MVREPCPGPEGFASKWWFLPRTNPRKSAKCVEPAWGTVVACRSRADSLAGQAPPLLLSFRSQRERRTLKRLFKSHGLVSAESDLASSLQKEGELELWVENSKKTYILVKKYSICATSGILGPKRRWGDEQVPQGFYELDWFNLQSNFYLSLHISYPNAADPILGSKQNLGRDIFLHKSCVTIGCIPVTDDGIKEITGWRSSLEIPARWVSPSKSSCAPDDRWSRPARFR